MEGGNIKLNLATILDSEEPMTSPAGLDNNVGNGGTSRATQVTDALSSEQARKHLKHVPKIQAKRHHGAEQQSSPAAKTRPLRFLTDLSRRRR